jgi:predicted ArsR family transcriptional regulator
VSTTGENGARPGHSRDVIVRRVPPTPNPILLWLLEHGAGTAHDMASDLGRDPDSVGAALRAFRADGRVRVVREERGPAGGRPRAVYALVKQHNDEQEAPETMSVIGQDRSGPTREELDKAEREDELTAADMEELLAAYCGAVPLAEADSRVLLFVLRMRRVQDRLREAGAA